MRLSLRLERPFAAPVLVSTQMSSPLPATSPLRPWPRPWLTAVVTVLLALHAWLGWRASLEHSLIYDEVGHLTGGHAYWSLNDYRFHPENGNLPQRWAALPWRFAGATLPPEPSASWARSDVWTVGDAFLFRSGHNTIYLSAWSHLLMMVFSLGTAALVFATARRAWGDAGGVFALALFAFSPTFLAHGPLATSDVTMTFFFLASPAALWAALHRPTPSRIVLSLATTALACLAKHSFVLLLPILGGLILLHIWRPGRPPNPWSIPRLAGLITLHVAAAWLLIWTAFGWRYVPFSAAAPAWEKFYAPWELVMPREGLAAVAFGFARQVQLLPEAFLQGFAFVLHAAEQRGAYLAGEYRTTGWWWFFPFTFLLKSTLAELIALILAAPLLWRAWQRRDSAAPAAARALLPLGLLALVYGVVSLTTQLNIGHRHILPLYPVLFVAAGVLGASVSPIWIRWGLAPVLAFGAALTAFAHFPGYLAYFNPIGGGPMAGHRHLVDSSLDWGQDLPALATWQEKNLPVGATVFVSYFGSVPPAHYGVRGRALSPYPLVDGSALAFDTLRPGWYCISATMYRDVYSPFVGPWNLDLELAYQRLRAVVQAPPAPTPEATTARMRELWNFDRLRFARLLHYLRERPTDARPTATWFIFELTEREIDAVVDGSLTEIATLIEEHGRP